MSANLQRVSFQNDGRTIVGHLRFPPRFDGSRRYPSIVVVGPGSAVKEQAGAVYAHKLASEGFITLVFDPSFQGESEGLPRGLENPAIRVEDIRCAVDFLVTRSFIDENSFGLLGICAGGGYAINAALIERRFKAVGTVVATNIGSAFRRMQPQADAVERMLAEIGKQRTAEARGAVPRRVSWLPSLEETKAGGIDDPTLLNAIDYYATSRGRHDNRTNQRPFIGDAMILGFDSFHLVDKLLVQPLQVIVGGRLGKTFSYSDGLELWERARNRQDFVVIEGADHYDLYDRDEFVDEAIGHLKKSFIEFIGENVL